MYGTEREHILGQPNRDDNTSPISNIHTGLVTTSRRWYVRMVQSTYNRATGIRAGDTINLLTDNILGGYSDRDRDDYR